MNDGVELTNGNMVKGVKDVVKIAEAYGSSISYLKAALDAAGGSFEDVGNTPRGAWEEYLNAIWGVLADSQDNVNDTADKVVKYTEDMFNTDVDAADGLEDAKRPKEGK